MTRWVMVSNSAVRLESIAKLGTISLSEDAYRQVKSRLDLAAVTDWPAGYNAGQ